MKNIRGKRSCRAALLLLAACVLAACAGSKMHRRVPIPAQLAEQQHFEAYLLYRMSFSHASNMSHVSGISPETAVGGDGIRLANTPVAQDFAVRPRLLQCSLRLFTDR